VSAETDFRAILTGYTALTDIVPAARIAQNAVDDGVATPYIVFKGKHFPDHGLDNTVLSTNVQFSVACWADDSLSADAVADQVVAALLADGVVHTERDSDFAPDIGLAFTLIIFDWWQ